MTILLAGCGTVPGAHPVALISPEADRVQAALDHWPKVPPGGAAIKRPFFTTIHAAGQRTTASGILEYYGPRDFRITAATEMGVILFDARMNWAGVTVLRQMPGLSSYIVETLVGDLSRALELPDKLDGLEAGDEKMILKKRSADTHQYTWIFDRATGKLLQTDVDLGTFDTLHITFRGYTATGWPEDVEMVRKARMYDVSFTFTDNKMVQGTWENR